MTIFLHCIVKYFGSNKKNTLNNNRLDYNPCDTQISFFSSSTFPALFGHGWCLEQGVAYVHAIIEIIKLQIVNSCKSNSNSATQSENIQQNANETGNPSYSEYDLLSDQAKEETISSSDFYYSFINKIITQFLHMAGIQNYLRAALSTDFWTLCNDEIVIQHEKEISMNTNRTTSYSTSSAINIHTLPPVSSKGGGKKKKLKLKIKHAPQIPVQNTETPAAINKSDEYQQESDHQIPKEQYLVRILKYMKQFTESLLHNISRMPSIIRYFFQKVAEIDKSGLLVELIFIDYLLKSAILKPKFFALIPETAVFSSTQQLTILTKFFKASIHEHLIPDEYRDLLTGKEKCESTGDESPMKLFNELNVKRIIEKLSSNDDFDGKLEGLNGINVQSVTDVHYNLILISVNDIKFITKIVNDTIDTIDCFEETSDPNEPLKFQCHVNESERKKIKSLVAFGEKIDLKDNDLMEFWYQSFRLPNIDTTKTKQSKKDKKKKSKDKKSKKEKKKENNEENNTEINEQNEYDNQNDQKETTECPSPEIVFKSGSIPNAAHRPPPPHFWKKNNLPKKPKSSPQSTETDNTPNETNNENNDKDDFDIANFFKATIPPLLLPIILTPEITPFDPKDPYIKTIYHLTSYLQETRPLSSNNNVNLMDFLQLQLKHAIQIKSTEWITRTQAIFNKLENSGKTEDEHLSTLSNIVNSGLKKSSDLLASSFKHQEYSDFITDLLTKTDLLRAQLKPISSQALLRKFFSTKQTITEKLSQKMSTFQQMNEWVNFFKDECVTELDSFVDDFLTSTTTEQPKPMPLPPTTKNSSKSKTKSKTKSLRNTNSNENDTNNNTNTINNVSLFSENELKTIKFNLVRQCHSDLCTKYLSFSAFKQLTNNKYSHQDEVLQKNYDKLLENYTSPDASKEFSKVLLRLFSTPKTFDSAVNTLQKGIISGAPLERLEQIDVTLSITQEIYKFEAGESAAADDLIPLFINVLIRAKIPELASLTNYIDHFLNSLSPSVKIVDHKEEYVITTFLTASNYVIREAEKMENQ